MPEPQVWDETHTTDFGYASAYRVEAKPDGLRVIEFDPRYGEPIPYASNFITIPKDLVPWFAEVVTLAANRSPLFDSSPRKEGSSDA